MSVPVRSLSLLVLSVAVVAAVVWAVGGEQQRTVDRSFRQSEAAQGMLTAMLDRETGLRGFLQTGQQSFLAPYRQGDHEFALHSAEARRTMGDLGPAVARLLERQERLAARWHGSAEAAIVGIQRGTIRRVRLRDAVARKELMDRIRASNAALQVRVDEARASSMRDLRHLSAALVVGLAALFAGGGWGLFGRRAARQQRRELATAARRERQTDFARTLQVMDGEHEAHELVKRHLERTVPDSRVVVLQRNNSADRLEAVTAMPEGDALGAALREAAPRSCLAVRLGRTHADGAGEELLTCELCARTGTERAVCTPLLVSGEVIGSVLVGHEAPLGRDGQETIADTVTQAAPVLANMRNLAIAEERAATDALTGLANRRAVQDTIRRMIAQAQRGGTSMAAIAMDVDHFKRINDRFGHDRGDDVLAAVGQVLSGTLRTSDFVGRHGGEEFIALLPDTGLSGALTAAESLREAVERLEFPGFDRPVTASFGVAIFPEDGLEPGALLRTADRALYAAKARGRNRVEAAAGTEEALRVSPETAA